eukprot:IDg9175t1
MFRQGDAFRQASRKSRNSRRWRHELDVLVPGFYGECDVIQRSGVQTARYPLCPEGFGYLEVPYGFSVDIPSVCHLWGLTMADFPYRERQTCHRRGPIVYAIWSAFHMQWVRNFAFEFFAAAVHLGDNGRL